MSRAQGDYAEDSDEDVEGSGEDDEGDQGSERSEQDQWRRFGWVVFGHPHYRRCRGPGRMPIILINRSRDRTAELISLFEEGQQQRTAALGQIPQSQEPRQAALESQSAQTRAFQADVTGCPGEPGQG